MSFRRASETLLYDSSFSRESDHENKRKFHSSVHPLIKSSSIYHSVASQDSVDTFHDAVSSPHGIQKESFLFPSIELDSEDNIGYRSRTRHASSGPRLECERVPTKCFPHGTFFRGYNGLRHCSFDSHGILDIEKRSDDMNELIINETDEASIVPSVSPSPVSLSSRGSHSSKSKSSTQIADSANSRHSSQLQPSSSEVNDDSKDEFSIMKKKISDEFIYVKPRPKKSILRQIKDEFALENFKFDHKFPHLFVTSQWQQPNHMCCMYLAYRLFWGVYFTMWSIWSLVGFGGYDSAPSKKLYYLLYLTDWAIWLLALDTMMQAVNVGLHLRKVAFEGTARYNRMKSSFKISWALSTITSSIHLFITFMFWTLIFTEEKYPITAIILNTRVVPCIYVLIDSLVSATPRRVLHAYLPMLLLTIYGIATDIYYLVGGKSSGGEVALYPILDWSQPLQTLMFGSCLILLLIPLIHVFIVCLLSGMRNKLQKTLSHTEYKVAYTEEAYRCSELKV